MQKILNSFLTLYLKMNQCKQFNQKVELNQKVKAYKDKHKIKIIPIDQTSYSKKILVDGVHVANLRYMYEKHKNSSWNFNPINYTIQLL